MGVIAASITSLGLATGVACVVLVAVGETGCAGATAKLRPGTTSTTRAPVLLSPVRRPRPPAPYAVPRHALRVTSSSQLASALSDGRREAIVLAPGIYDAEHPFADREGDQIYASRLGRSVLRAGIVLGGNSGPPGGLIRGLTLSVSDPRKTLHGDAIHVWGSAANASVLDTDRNRPGRQQRAAGRAHPGSDPQRERSEEDAPRRRDPRLGIGRERLGARHADRRARRPRRGPGRPSAERLRRPGDRRETIPELRRRRRSERLRFQDALAVLAQGLAGLARQPERARLVERHRRGLSLAREPGNGAAGERQIGRAHV